jgi:hypothetical protein
LVSNVAPPAPSGASREEMSVAVPAAHCTPPPFSVTMPVPKLPSAEKLIRPPLTVVPPV